MPTLDDLTILDTLTAPVGGDFIPVSDTSASGSGPSKIRKLALNSVFGLSATDVVSTVAGTITVAGKLTLIVSGTTSTVNIPAASGDLRDIIVMNGGSGNATVTSATANIITSLATTAATTAVLGTTGTARFLSNGTNWYRTH